MSCTIVVEQVEAEETTTAIYNFSDYRIAIAISNIMDNMIFVHKDYSTRSNDET